MLAALHKHKQLVVPELKSLFSQSPPKETEPDERDPFWKIPDERDVFWKMQANAAVCLLELGETKSVWPLFRQTPNPSLRSFIIDQLALLGANHETLVARLKQESDPASRYALILALGQFDLTNMSSQQRRFLAEKLAAIYRDDPNSGVHSAADWVLRNWQKNQIVTEADSKRKASLSEQDRNWFINLQGQTFAVVIGPVEFLMGDKVELPGLVEKVTLSHRFAVATHEVTGAQFRKFRSDHQYYYEPDCPVNEVSWYDAVAYCNWLSEQERIPKDQWCYEPNDEGKYAEGMKIPADDLERTGYRLPTQEEWEFVCRAGTTSSYGFGEPLELLTKYAWYEGNAEYRSRPVGLKLPNALGAFDMHGNASEWCHGLFIQTLQPGTVVKVNEKEKPDCRGGSYFHPPRSVRSTGGGFGPPSERDAHVGFRPSRTLPPIERKPNQ